MPRIDLKQIGCDHDEIIYKPPYKLVYYNRNPEAKMFIPLLPVFPLRPTQTTESYLYYCQATELKEEAFPLTVYLAEQGCVAL